MKALIFTSQIHCLGGAERLAIEAAIGLNQMPEVRCDVLVAEEPGLNAASGAEKHLLCNGVSQVLYLGRRARSGARGFVQHVRKLRHILAEGRYNVVETSLLGPTILASWATRRGSAAHVAGIHLCYERNRENSMTQRFLGFCARWNKQTRFYAISQDVRTKWLAYSRTSPKRTTLVYNSIGDAYFEHRFSRQEARQRLGMPGNTILVIVVGTIRREKGFHIAIEAMLPWLQTNSCVLGFVGRTEWPGKSREEADALLANQQRIRDLGVDGAVRFLGFYPDTVPVYAAADVVLQPSLFEGFGLTVAEALAAGVPLVASGVGGIPEVVEGTATLLVPPGDPLALRAAVAQVLARNPAERARCIQLGQARAESFRAEQRWRKLVSLFQAVAGQSQERQSCLYATAQS